MNTSSRYLVASVVLALGSGSLIAHAQQQAPQERQFTVTLTERQWLYIGSLLDEQKVKEAGPITYEIQGQLRQNIQQQAAAAQNNVEKSIRDRLASDAAKAAEEKAKAEAAAKAAAPVEEKKDP